MLLFVGARPAEHAMRVRVDESRREDAAAAVDLVARRGYRSRNVATASDGGDALAVDGDGDAGAHAGVVHLGAAARARRRRHTSRPARR